MPDKKKHEDTSVSLHPRTFREAVKELADSPPQKRTKKDGAPSDLRIALNT